MGKCCIERVAFCAFITGCMAMQPCVNGETFVWEILRLSAFFQRHTSQLIITQNSLNDADSGKDVPFGVKIKTFCTT